MTSSQFEEQIKIWSDEQEHIATQVIVLEDESDEQNDSVSSYSNDFYEFTQIEVSGPSNASGKSNKNYFGGVDVTFPTDDNQISGNNQESAVAVYCIVNASCEVVYMHHEFFEAAVPYISSFLAFREIPPLERLVKHQIKERPELTPKVILVDGNGILHTRSAGIACFLGVKTGLPTIGVGKTFFHHDGLTTPLVNLGIAARMQRFLHKHTQPTPSIASNSLGAKEGCELPYILAIDKEYICPPSGPNNFHKATATSCAAEDMEALSQRCQAFAVRLQGNSKRVWGAAVIGHGRGRKRKVGSKNPIFVSVGHSISLKESLIICTTLSCNSRIPEPIRQADIHGRELLRHRNNCKAVKTGHK